MRTAPSTFTSSTARVRRHRWLRRPTAVLLVIAAVACLVGCTATNRRKLGSSCGGNAECESSLCRASVCTNSCQSTDDCEGGVCFESACQPLTSVTCAQDSLCDGLLSATSCQTGRCNAGLCELISLGVSGSTKCDDKNPCTTDTCDASSRACAHTANLASCDDGDLCTTSDACKGGVCLAGASTGCDEGNPCTDDTCNPAKGCSHAANQATCDDGNACTTGDLCSNGNCGGAGAVKCDDGNPCTDDSCSPASGCTAGNVDGAPCSDGNTCTLGDACQSGVCLPGAATTCDDGNVCTSDSCASGKGCTFTNNTSECQDGSLCTIGDNCKGGICLPGATTGCDDGNPCTDDSCEFDTGCFFAPLANGATCTDGSACTWGDACAGGVCMPGGVTSCDDASLCTVDSCNKVSGCNHANTCDDNDPCTTDGCNPAMGCLHLPLSDPLCNSSAAFVELFACASDATAAWQKSDSTMPEEFVKWRSGPVPSTLVTQPGACPVHINNGTDLKCATGQAALNASADSPVINLSQLPQGTPVTVAFSSAGGWDAGKEAAIAVNVAGSGWTALGTIQPSANWSKLAFSSPGWAGNTVQFRFSFSGTCTSDMGEGWFVDAFSVSADTCLDHPGVCGPGSCAYAATGQLDCTFDFGASCLAIRNVAPSSPDGVYWLSFTGVAEQYYCDMKNGGWTRLIADDFEAGPAGWSQGGVTNCGKYGKILGGYNQFGKGAAPSKSVAAPPHTQAKLWLQYIRLDTWINQWAQVYVDSAQVWTQQSPADEWTGGWNNKCGRWDYADDEWDMGNGWVGAHSAATVTVTATSTLDQGADQESFGLDNVVLYVK